MKVCNSVVLATDLNCMWKESVLRTRARKQELAAEESITIFFEEIGSTNALSFGGERCIPMTCTTSDIV